MMLATTQCFLLLVPLRHSQPLKKYARVSAPHMHPQPFFIIHRCKIPRLPTSTTSKGENFGCAKHKLHGEEGLTTSSSVLGRWSATARHELRNVAAGSSSGRHQHAKEQKQREQSSDVKKHFFAAAKQVKVARRRV
jgi:hypothetical protein